MRRPALSNASRINAIAIAAALALSSSSGGCSFLFSEGAPAHHEERASFDCGESYAPPVLDTVAAGLWTLALGGEARSPDPKQTTTDHDTALAVLSGLVALDVAAAVYGYHAVGDCRSAKTARAAAVARASVLPPPYGVPPWGAPPSYWPPPVGLPPPAAPAPAKPAPPVAAPPPTSAEPPAPPPAPPETPAPPSDEPTVTPLQ